MLKKSSDTLWKMESSEKGSVLFFTGESPEKRNEILEQAEKLIEEESIDFPIAMLSEMHRKSNIKTPSGTIVASSSYIIPEAMDAAPNCGMRVIMTDMREDELNNEKIKGLFAKITEAVPTGGVSGKKISRKLVDEIFMRGSAAVSENFKLTTKNEIVNTYENGNFFQKETPAHTADILKAIPPFISWIGKFRLNLLGATKSHFLYLARVSAVRDQEKADAMGISLGQYLFFMHTGSSIVGRYAASIYSPRKISSFLQRSIISFIKRTSPRNIRLLLPKTNAADKMLSIPAASPEGKATVAALGAVSNYGFANRALITQSLSATLDDFFQRKVKTELLYDAPHVFLSLENQNGKDIWVHRNGANRAFGSTMMKDHPIYGKTGEPVLIAPFEGTPGYIGVGTDENESAYFSANHEIGKSKDLSIPRDQFMKYAKKAINEMEQNKLLKVVAEVEPLEVLTY